MLNYISKQTSYDVAYEVAQKAKKVLGLSEYDRETLEHDINNLRAHEWIDLFNMIPDSNEVKKLYFTHCVELEDENEQELDESMNTFTTVRTRLNRLCSPYQAQLWDNGRFEVHQVKEDDKDRLVNSLRRISKEVHATANGKYDFSRPAMFGGIHSQYYNIYGEIEMEDKNESLQLTEGHDVQEYKGFELDLDTDLTNHNWEDEEYIITPTVEIKYNGKVLATANGYRAARAWVDKHVKVVPYTPKEKIDCIVDIITEKGHYCYCGGDQNNMLVIFEDEYEEQCSTIIYIKSLTEIYYSAELETMDRFLSHSNISRETLLQAFPRLTEDTWDTAVQLTIDHIDSGVTDSPLMTKVNSIETLVETMAEHIPFYGGLSDEQYENLIKEEKIIIDGKVLKESYDDQELEKDMEINKKLMLVWNHFNPSNINLIYDNDFSRLESYMSTEDDIICENEGAVESGIFLLAHNDESEMLSFVGHSIEDVKTKFIQVVEQAKVEAQEYEDEDLNLGDPFYYCTDNLNLSSEEMFNEWISWITSSQVDGDSGYAWHLIDVANKQVLYGSEESEVIFYDSVDEYFNDLTGGLDNTEGEELEENTITNTLPPVIDQFLMDCAQMYCNFDYTDISKFGERATEDEIKLLRKIRADLKDGFDEDDPEVKDIFNEIEKIVKGTDLTESVLMEKDPNLTDSQKKYVEDMYNKDMEFYGFASYDSEDDFVEDVTIDFDESEAIEMYKYYKQLHEVNKADESLNRDVVEEPELDESYNPTGIANIAKNLKVNGPRSREDRKPEAIPGYINEINIPDNMRLKSYDFREQDNTLYIEWVTQESFNSEDVNKFIDEVAAAVDFIADSLDFIEEFEAVIEVTSRDGKEYGYAKERLRFEPKGTESEQIEEARSNNSLSARLKARLNKLTECNSEDQLTEEKLSTRLIRRLNQGKINEAPIVEEVTDIDLTEESLKWNMGSNKLVSTDSEEFARLVDLAKLLQEKSPNGFMYTVEKTYEDFGAGMQWYNIICHNKKGDRWQVLNTKQWLELANGKLTVEQSYDSIIKDEYFQDKISGDVNTMNHSQLLKFMDSFDEE